MYFYFIFLYFLFIFPFLFKKETENKPQPGHSTTFHEREGKEKEGQGTRYKKKVGRKDEKEHKGEELRGCAPYVYKLLRAMLRNAYLSSVNMPIANISPFKRISRGGEGKGRRRGVLYLLLRLIAARNAALV